MERGWVIHSLGRLVDEEDDDGVENIIEQPGQASSWDAGKDLQAEKEGFSASAWHINIGRTE